MADNAWHWHVELNAGGPVVGRADPDWSDDGAPRCSEECRFHDGKRCQLLGARPGWLCEPVVVEMARLLDKLTGGRDG
jgi:hypothetical protein